MPTSFAQFASRLSPRGWLIAAGSALGGILLVYLFLHMVSQPSYSTLMTGIEPAQTGKMTSTLSQHGIAYELQNNGTALAVQSNKTAEARVALASAGLLNSSQPGFSLFEKTSIGESNFQQQVTYQRALQGQLEQTIDNIQGISGAQVELVLPSAQNQLFAESQTAASAAVLLGGTPSLPESSVRGIAQLVASSVPGLQLEKVTVTDSSGQLLWPAQGSSEGAGAGLSAQEAQARYDQTMEANLDAMLAQTLGPGKAQAQVYANVNANQATQETLSYGKTGVPLTQTKDTETLTGNGAGAGGTTGAAAIPAYTAATNGGKSNYKHEQTNTTLGVDKTITHAKIAPGAVNQQHVSVLLDRSVPASSLPTIRAAVAAAAGIEPKRGDTLSVGQMAFAKPSASGPSTVGGILGDIKYALIGLAALAFLLFTTRSLRRREHAAIEHEPSWLHELDTPVRLAELERENAQRTEMQPVPVGTASTRRRIEALASASPDRVAQHLRSWIQED